MGLFREHGITGWRRKARVYGKPDFVLPKARVAEIVAREALRGVVPPA